MPRRFPFLFLHLTSLSGKATKLPNSTVPWSTLSRGHENLIDGRYLPRRFEFRDPSKLSVEAARSLLEFWIGRQEDPEEWPTFRFRGVVKKNGEIAEVEEEDEPEEPSSPSPRQKRKVKGKGKEKAVNLSDHEEIEPPRASHSFYVTEFLA